MKTILTIIAFLYSQISAWCEEEQKVPVHITGHVEKPGTYSFDKKVTAKQVFEACGGWDKTWAAPKRIVLIRLARGSNATMDLPARDEDLKIIYDLTNEDKIIEFAYGDILFIPAKEWIGR